MTDKRLTPEKIKELREQDPKKALADYVAKRRDLVSASELRSGTKTLRKKG